MKAIKKKVVKPLRCSVEGECFGRRSWCDKFGSGWWVLLVLRELQRYMFVLMGRWPAGFWAALTVATFQSMTEQMGQKRRFPGL